MKKKRRLIWLTDERGNKLGVWDRKTKHLTTMYQLRKEGLIDYDGSIIGRKRRLR
jgi:hypothetical protein